MRALILCTLMLLASAQEKAPDDPNGSGSSGETRRPPIDFRVFNKMEKPIAGAWTLVVPEASDRRVDLKEEIPGDGRVLVGVDPSSGQQMLRVVRKKEGIGYEGQIERVLAPCGLDVLPVSEFLPLGDAIVLRFETALTEIPCPPIDSGKAGRFEVLSRRGGPVRLRDLSDISSSSVRDAYSIGGDRTSTDASITIPLGAVSIDNGAPVRFVGRVKSPLDGSLWFEVEAVIAGDSAEAAPRGYVKADSVRFIGSLVLNRIDDASPR